LQSSDRLAGVDIEIHACRVRQDHRAVVHNRISAADGEVASVDGGATGVGVGARHRKRPCPILRDSERATYRNSGIKLKSSATRYCEGVVCPKGIRKRTE